MAKFYGRIGYFKEDVEVSPGVIENLIEERHHYGDILKESQSSRTTDQINSDIRLNNYISILADNETVKNSYSMRYIECFGSLWEIASIEIVRPRILIRLGGIYNGPTA